MHLQSSPVSFSHAVLIEACLLPVTLGQITVYDDIVAPVETIDVLAEPATPAWLNISVFLDQRLG
jgi:hypothetical protein